MAKTHVIRQDTDARVSSLTINGTAILATSIVLGTGEVADLNGEKLIIDADTDTYIQQTGGPSGTDDSFGIVVNGAEDFRVTANTLTALSGSTIATNTIAETTAAAGVTIDSTLIKDGGIRLADGAAIAADVVSEKTAAAGVTVDGVLIKDGGAIFADAAAIEVDTVNEATSAAGVTVDGVLLKDTIAHGRTAVAAALVNGAITIPAYNQVIFFTKAGVAAMTIADPTTGTHDGVTLTFIAATANAHTLDNSAGSGFFSSGGGTKDVFTLGGAIGDGFSIIAYLGKWYVDPRGVTNATLG